MHVMRRRVPAIGDMVRNMWYMLAYGTHTQNTFYPEHILLMPARGDMVRAMLGDCCPRNDDVIQQLLIGVPETDEMPDRRVSGDGAAPRHAPSAPHPPPPPFSGGPNSGDVCVSCQHAEAADSDSSGRPPTHALLLLLLFFLLYYYTILYHVRLLRMYARACTYMMDSAQHMYAGIRTQYICICTHQVPGR
jgi:hypothetical protein